MAELEMGYCALCRKQARRNPEAEDHWWHVDGADGRRCLRQMIVDANWRPYFVYVV